ncbi:MAG: S8 family serine peptidase [Planctomycetota bacterium]
MKRTLFAVVVAGLVTVSAVRAQQPNLALYSHDLQSPPQSERADAAPMAACLSHAEALVRNSLGTIDDHRRVLAAKSIVIRDDEKVRVEIFGPKGESLNSQQLEAFGFEVVYSFPAAVEGWAPARQLTTLARSLPTGWQIHPCGAGLQATATEGTGPALMDTALYRDDGYDGSGIHIAVIDVGYVGLADSVSSGDAPSPYDGYDFTGNGLLAGDSDDNHGRFVVETVYDHAPGAQYSIIRVASQTQVLAAANTLPGLGVDVVCMSLAWWPSWEDDSSTSCDAVNFAGSNGILFLSSAGNSADNHYGGSFTDQDADDWHNFDLSDESLTVIVDDDSTVSFGVTWDRAGGTHDYDVTLYDVTNTVILDSSTASGETYESVSWENTTGGSVIVNLAIRRISGPGTELSIHSGGATWLQYVVPQQSYLTPSDATHANAISVGAVESAFYGSSNFTNGIAAVYSSQGPTHEGSQCPDICAPTSTNGSFFSNFIGTSCAAPHAAGMVACLWSVNPSGTASQVRSLVFEWADKIRDWGAPGADSIYGRGGVCFPPFADCNTNNFPDALDIESGAFSDNNGNWIPDPCESLGFHFALQVPLKINVPPQNGVARFNAVASISGVDNAASPNPSTLGFQMAIAYDTSILTPVSVQPGDDLLAIVGSAPAFFTVDHLPGGTAVDCLYAPPPVPGDVPFTSDISFGTTMTVLELETIPTAFVGGPMPTATIGFSDALGVAGPILNEVYVDSTSPATVHLEPATSLDFVSNHGFTCQVDNEAVILEQSAGAGTISTRVRYVEFSPNNAPSAVEGFAMTIVTQLGLGLQSAAVTPIVQSLNGGSGPAFLSVDLANGARVDCVVGAGDSLSFLGSPAVVDLTYDIAAFLFALPAPTFLQVPVQPTSNDVNMVPAVNHVTVGGVNYTPSFDEGFMTIGIIDSPAPMPEFRRGDANGDSSFNVADAVFTLSYLFSFGAGDCLDSMDTNDDGTVNIADPVAALSFLFAGGAQPPTPFAACGADPTPDSSTLPMGDLGCVNSPACP